jgi:Family of unknown function (DUF6166)
MKVYRGTRTKQDVSVTAEDGDACRQLNPRHDLYNHSPSGLEWGYSGSGPAQLALALAADVIADDAKALVVYQELKFQLVSRLEFDGWTLTEEEILTVIREIYPEFTNSE